jgi:hypothetical protein
MANIQLPDDKKEAFINELLEAKNTRYIFESIIARIYYEGWTDGYESEDHKYRDLTNKRK